MTTLIAGLVLFLGIHLLPTVPALRSNLAARWGERRYKGMFALVSFAGLALIIAGYAMAERGAQLFPPQPAAIRTAAAPNAARETLRATTRIAGVLPKRRAGPQARPSEYG